MARFAPFRVQLWDINATHRGRGNSRAIIEDAIDVGVSAYANKPGEMFFTLPMSHPAIEEVLPWERHYEVTRLNTATMTYETVGTGLIEDYDASANDVTFYGIDGVGLIGKVITPTTTYTSEFIGSILSAEMTTAKSTSIQPNNLYQNWTLGTIDTTTRTVTVFTSREPRLTFFSGLIDILQAGGTTRPIITVSRSYPHRFSFEDNQGSDKKDVRLEFGGAVLDYRYLWGGDRFVTAVSTIGVKREGATVLYANATSPSTDKTKYGLISSGAVFIDLINQAELNSKTNTMLADLYYRAGTLFLSLAQGYVRPWGGWDLGDSVPVIIDRGIVSIDALYTIWGMEWIGRLDGSENMFLDLQPKLV